MRSANLRVLLLLVICLGMSSFAYADGNFDGQIDNSGRHVVVEAEQKDSAPGFVGATGS